MCGIFGAVGHSDVLSHVVRGLSDLEYRGYDSAGIGALLDGRIVRRRVEGALANLQELLAAEPLQARTVIGHTRWATHGAPLRHNAHPHATARVAVVHNGIIENHTELRTELSRAGATFRSETDTEVVAWLVDRELAAGATPLEAVMRALPRLRGSHALALIFAGCEGLVIAARRGSPLAVGRSSAGSFLASDPDALGRVASEAALLADGELAVLDPRGVRVLGGDGRERAIAWTMVERGSRVLDKGNHVDFTHKEIHEQPEQLEQSLAALQSDLAGGRAERWCGALARAERIAAVACGTSFYAAYTARAWLEGIGGVPVELDLASEFHTRQPLLSPGTAGLLVSQSGETADTLAALRHLKQRGVPTVALVNVATSAMAREADGCLLSRAGREVGVASTKAFTAQLFALAAAALAMRKLRGLGQRDELESMVAGLAAVPAAVRAALALEPACAELGRALCDASRVIYLGRGASHALALEGALKLKELSYVHAEGFAAGELKHGPLALVERGTKVIVIAPFDGTFDRTLSNVREVLARGADPVLLVDGPGAEVARREGLRHLELPTVESRWAPLVMAVPLQLLAYHAAASAGRNVDRPRNLAKSVTVE